MKPSNYAPQSLNWGDPTPSQELPPFRGFFPPLFFFFCCEKYAKCHKHGGGFPSFQAHGDDKQQEETILVLYIYKLEKTRFGEIQKHKNKYDEQGGGAECSVQDSIESPRKAPERKILTLDRERIQSYPGVTTPPCIDTICQAEESSRRRFNARREGRLRESKVGPSHG